MYKNSKNILFFSILIFFILIGLVFSFNFIREKEKKEKKNLALEKQKVVRFNLNEKEIVAKNALVLDLSSGEILFSKKPNEVKSLASITKIMTAITALDLFQKNVFIPITEEAIKEEGDSGLIPGEEITLEDLIKFMLVSSSNDSAVAINEYFKSKNIDLINQMNLKAKEIGLTSTYFINETGLDRGIQPGGVANSFDVARLMNYAMNKYSDVFSVTKYKEYNAVGLSNRKYLASNTNAIAQFIEGLKISKTGFSETAQGNLAIISEIGIGRNLAIVVMDSTYDDRFKDAFNLLKESINYLSQKY